MHGTNNQFSDKFNNDWKKIKMAALLSFLAFSSIILPCSRNNDIKFDNGGGLLSSVLSLYKTIFFSI